MQDMRFVAISPFEIGDRIGVDGTVKTTTDIACVHFARDGAVTWYFQLDNEEDYWHEDRFTIGISRQ